MMKKILGLGLLIFLSYNLFASHLVGGSLGYEYMGKVGLSYRYKIKLIVYNNCDGTSQIPLPVQSHTVSVYSQDIPNNPMGGGNKTFVQNVTVLLVDSNQVTPPVSSGCAIGQTVCIYKGVYEATVDLPLNFNGYHLYFENFARNNNITNLLNPGGTAMAFHSYIAPSLVNNSTPVFLDDPVPFLCVNDTVSILNTAIDPDGDQLIFSFVTPMSGNGTSPSPLPWTIPTVLYNGGYSTAQPFGAGGYSFINGSNGLTQYMATALGNYVVAVEIREYRAGKLIGVSRRDLQLLVISCPPNPAPNLSSVGGSGTTQYTISECDNLNFPITFTDANGDSLTLTANGQIFDPAFITPPATLNSPVTGDALVTSNFNWTAPCGSGQALPYIFSISVTDKGCPPKTTNEIYEITVTPPTAPSIISGSNMVCENTTLTYTTNSIAGSTYSWSVTGGVINSGQGTNSISITWGNAGSGTIEVNSLNTCGCPSTIIDTNVTILASPTSNAGPDTTICLGNSLQIGGSPTGPFGSTFSWTPTTNINNTTIANPTVSPTSTTDYIVTVSNGVCSSSDTVRVTVGSALINAGNDTSMCFGANVQLNVTGGVSYSWSPIAGLSNPNIANPIANPVTTTIYTATITDALGCTGIDSVIVTVVNPPTISITADTTICLGSCVQLLASGGLNYQWSPSASLSNTTIANPNACPLTSTTYIVTVSNAAGCSSVDSVKVNVNSLPIIQTNNDTATCIGNCIQLNAVGGTSYSWSPITGLSDPNIANPSACAISTTSYVVTGTDLNGCSAKDTIVITINNLPTVNAGTDQSICGTGSVIIGGTPSGPAGSSFSWTPSGTLNNSSIANPTASPLSTTNYILTVVDVNGCSKIDSVLVTVNPLPTILVSNDTAVCLGSSAQLTASGAVSYSWTPITALSNPSIANPLATPLVNTTYTVNALDANGCANSNSVTVNVNSLPIVNAGNDATICLGDSTQLLASGATSFVWSPASGLSNTTVANPFAFPTSTTSYIVVGSDNNLCVNRDTVVVNVNPLPVINAGADTAFCDGASVQLNASGATSFVWSPATGLSNPNIANPLASPTSTTLYTVTGTDGNSCSNTDAVLVTVNPLPTILVSNDTAVCLGSSAQLTASGAVSYSWTPITALSNPSIANPVATPLVNTTYTVNALDVNGCANSNSVTVNVNSLPSVNAGNDATICLGDSTQLLASGATSFVWSPATGLSNTTVANPFAFPNSTTSYIVVGSDNNLCVNRDTVVVNVNPLPVINAGADEWLCIGNDIPLNASGGISYNWSPTTGLSNPNIANPVADPLTTSTYTVTGIDINGCSNSDDITITVNNIVPINIGNNDTICIGDSIQLGGNPTSPAGTTYSWTPSISLSNPTAANPIAFPSVTTTYYLTATNDTCSSIDSLTIFVNLTSAINAGSDVNICIGDTIQLQAVGGISYVWSPTTGLSNSTIENPLAFPTITTEYIVSVTDNNGCSALDSVIVTVNPLPVINAGADTAFCDGASVQLNASGATSYVWSPAIGLSNPNIANPVANPTSTTLYTVTGTDGNSCSNTDAVLVTVNPLPTILVSNDTAVCLGSSAQLTASGAVSYSWTPITALSNPSIANPVATPLVNTTYTVNALDVNGCANSNSVTVNVNSLPIVNTGNDATICLGDSTQLLASGATSFVWSPATGLSNTTVANPFAFPNSTTSYIVVGSDNNLCVNRDTVVVNVNPLPLINAGADTAFCDGASVQLNASGATSFVWSPATGLSNPNIANPVASPTSTTLYTVTGTDGNSCSNTDAVLVTVNPLPTILVSNDTAVCLGSSAQLTASGAVSYSWTPITALSNPSIANPVATPLVNTTYTVNALDVNGCANSNSVTVNVNSLPSVNAGNDATICLGDSTQLLASGATSFVWSPATGLSNTTVANPFAFPNSTTSYIVVGSDNNLCVNRDTVVVNVNPLPLITIGNSDTVNMCLGDSIQLIANGGVSYIWTPNTFISNNTAFNPFVYPPTTSVYTVVGTDANSCKNRDSIVVHVFTIPNLTDTTICIGDSIQLNVNGPSNATYTWTPSTNLSNPNISNPYTNTINTITYSVTVQDINGCTDTKTITVSAIDKPIADFTVDTELSCEGIFAKFSNNSLLANNYVWNFGDGNQSTETNPTHIYTYGSSVTATLSAISINGCIGFSSAPIVNGNFENLFALVPATVFTPNRDGFNDLFRLDLPKHLSNCTNVQIFNRWGMLIFEAINQNIGWDGTTSTGTDVPAGTYFYVVEVNGIIKKGALTLLR